MTEQSSLPGGASTGSGAGGSGDPARVRAVPYGRPAIEALADAVRAAQADDPLAPVTVVVPSNTAGLVARRALGRAGGIANVSFVTPFQLAEHLGAAAVARSGHQPLTTAALGAAVRAQLAEGPGPFRRVAAHEATEAALVAAYGELSRARPETLARIEAEGGPWAAALVALLRAVRVRLAGYADEDTLADAARAAVADGSAPPVGALVVHLPQPLAPALADLLAALDARAPARVVVGLTGEPGPDRAVLATCARIGWDVVGAADAPEGPAVEVVVAADPDEEVRATVREVAALAESGVPLDRIALLYPVPEPYARIVHEQLDAAGVAFHGISVRTLADSVAGRTLLRLLDLATTELHRDEVIRLVSGAPVRDGRGEVPAHRWDLLSRRAGVLGGVPDWLTKLDAWRATSALARARLAEELETDARIEAMARDEQEVARLAEFVVWLDAAVAGYRDASTWADAARGARAALDALLGAGRGWPESERDAREAVHAALDRIGTLDGLDRPPDPERLRRAVERELAVTTGRTGRFGHGVLTGPLALGVGLDADAVFVLGMVEGSCPAVRQEESLLTDHVRSLAVEGELRTRTDALDAQRRDLVAALAAAGSRRVLLSARGDPRSGRSCTPSRWLLEAVSAAVGEPVATRDLATADLAPVRHVASFLAGVQAGPPGALVERDLAALDAAVTAGARATSHPVVTAAPALAAGLEAQHARASDAFTRWDGNLAGQPIPSPATGRSLSPTRLETWATCPFRYFLGQVLGLVEEARPEEIVELSALDRGSLVHEILERFVAEELARPPDERLAPGEPWPPAARERLHEIANECCAEYEDRGLTGRPLLWSLQQEELHADLDEFLRLDDARRAELGTAPAQVEMSFGFDGFDPVEITLPGGRRLAFRGQADRVDLTREGAAVVIDYKTGRSEYHAGVELDPVDRGVHLQLPLYAEAAAQRLGVPAAAAYYWFPTVKGGGIDHGYPLDAPRRQRFLAVLEEIVDGIEGGTFPMEPVKEAFPTGFENCRYCDFDKLCSSERLVQADAKADAPELVRFRTLRDTEFVIGAEADE